MKLSASKEHIIYAHIPRRSIGHTSASCTVIVAIEGYAQIISSTGDRFAYGRPALTRWRGGKCFVYVPEDPAPLHADCNATARHDS